MIISAGIRERINDQRYNTDRRRTDRSVFQGTCDSMRHQYDRKSDQQMRVQNIYKRDPGEKGEYYLWNYEPNQNQNAGDFWQQFVTNLLYDNAALIVEVGGKLYVADSFTRTHYSFHEDVFNNITIGDLTMQRSMLSHEVIYLELDNINARRRLEGSYTAYGQTVAKAIRSVLRAGAQKGILNIDAQTAAQPDFTTKLQTLITDRFKPFYDTDSAVLPLQTGYTYTDVTKQTTAPTPADLNERINYEFEMAGRAYKIPKALMLGDVSDVEKITKNFLTFAIDPICQRIGSEVTRKNMGKSSSQRETTWT